MSTAKKYPVSQTRVSTASQAQSASSRLHPLPSDDDLPPGMSAETAAAITAQEIEVKKVSPYPFEVQLTKAEGVPPSKGMIVKMTDFGFLMRVESIHCKVGENYQLSFMLPVLDTSVRAQGKVVKTYDGIEQMNKKDASKKHYIVELHFIELPSTAKTSINNYLVKSGQKKF